MSKYEVSLDDPALKNVEEEKTIATDASNALFDKAIADSNAGYDKAINASQNWVDRQTQLQKDQHAQDLKEINQQKEQTRKDYIKEQSGAYTDWQKQADPYGVNAERMASMGMSNTGYSESSQVSMYNAYQNRVAIARESYQRAVIDYDNQMQQAKLQNSTILAEIAYQGLQEQLKYAIEKVSAGNTLLVQKASEARAIDAQYQSKWQSVYNALSDNMNRKMQNDQFEENLEYLKWVNAPKQSNIKTYFGGGGGGNDNSSSDDSSDEKDSSTINNNGDDRENLSELVDKHFKSGTPNDLYHKAKQFIKEYNLEGGEMRLLSSQEWNRGKRTGEYGTELENFSTYRHYVSEYLKWRISVS